MQARSDLDWMQVAFQLAEKAEDLGEVPVGALIIKNDQIIGQGWNQPIKRHDPTAHAEIIALREAADHLQNYRLPGTTLYVTLEPCAMCAGAIVHARVDRLVFAASDPKAGACGSVFRLTEQLNHQVEVVSDVMADPCSDLLKNFFKKRR